MRQNIKVKDGSWSTTTAIVVEGCGKTKPTCGYILVQAEERKREELIILLSVRFDTGTLLVIASPSGLVAVCCLVGWWGVVLVVITTIPHHHHRSVTFQWAHNNNFSVIVPQVQLIAYHSSDLSFFLCNM